jgi:hypothetical protein
MQREDNSNQMHWTSRFSPTRWIGLEAWVLTCLFNTSAGLKLTFQAKVNNEGTLLVLG